MTTLVAVRKNDEIAIAADSLTTFGDTRLAAQHDRSYEKIVRYRDTCIGLCGSAAHQLVFESLLARHGDLDFSNKLAIFETFRKLHPILKEQHFLNPKEEDDDPYESTQITALVANRHGIFGVYSMREVFEYTQFWAVGSGREFALGAMHALYPRLKTADGDRAGRHRGRRHVRQELRAADDRCTRGGRSEARGRRDEHPQRARVGAPSSADGDGSARFVFEGAADPRRGRQPRRDLRDILGCHPYPPALVRALAEFCRRGGAARLDAQVRRQPRRPAAGRRPGAPAVVECDAALWLRATAQWRDAAARAAADASLACWPADPRAARLAITLDPKDGGPIYQGIVAIEAGSIATLIEHYLATSEQIDSRLVLAATGEGVRGLLLQRLPGSRAANDDAWQAAARRAEAFALGALPAAGEPGPLLQALFPRTTCACSRRSRRASLAPARASASPMRCGSSAAPRSRAWSPNRVRW